MGIVAIKTAIDPSGPEYRSIMSSIENSMGSRLSSPSRPSNWLQVGNEFAPGAPSTIRETGMDASILQDLALKSAYTATQFTTEWAARRLRLPQLLVGEILEQLSGDMLLDVLGQAGPFAFRYSISQRGRERAARLLEVSGYVGPAPVSLDSYNAALAWQIARFPKVSHERITAALAGMVVSIEVAHLAGLAVSSGRSLFLFGPPGNGKSSLGRALHEALSGDLWIPHCIEIGGGVIQLFDPHCHQPVEVEAVQSRAIDKRWIKIRRPLIIAGGEMTIDSLDLTYIPSLRSYEAPLHLKANGGTFLIDDFGRQRVDPHQLLNRWIIPLEHRIDYLTLRTGQKIQVPLMQMLIIATNLDLESVTDPAFLRRMGYRLFLDKPSPELYARIFEDYAARCGLALQPGLVGRLIDRYEVEGRELRCCEPHDLVERSREVCAFNGRPEELNEEVLDTAWTGYFGNKPMDT
jgi:hypothetical protein